VSGGWRTGGIGWDGRGIGAGRVEVVGYDGRAQIVCITVRRNRTLNDNELKSRVSIILDC